jgi:hypothetical protein
MWVCMRVQQCMAQQQQQRGRGTAVPSSTGDLQDATAGSAFPGCTAGSTPFRCVATHLHMSVCGICGGIAGCMGTSRGTSSMCSCAAHTCKVSAALRGMLTPCVQSPLIWCQARLNIKMLCRSHLLSPLLQACFIRRYSPACCHRQLCDTAGSGSSTGSCSSSSCRAVNTVQR